VEKRFESEAGAFELGYIVFRKHEKMKFGRIGYDQQPGSLDAFFWTQQVI